MRQLIYTLFLLSATSDLFGQNVNKVFKSPSTPNELRSIFNSNIQEPIEPKTNTSAFRMVGTSYYNYLKSTGSFDFIDSNFYHYSGVRFGGPTGRIDFDSSLYFKQINNTLHNDTRQYTTYDVSNSPELTIVEKWNSNGNKWEKFSYQSFSYDNMSGEHADTTYLWDVNSNVYIPWKANIKTYSVSGNLDHIISYDFLDNLNNLPINETVFTYDANGLLIDELFHHIPSTTWNELKRHKIYNYNGIGQLNSVVFDDYDFANQKWVASGGNYYTYDFLGNRIRAVYIECNYLTGQCDSIISYQVSYDNNHNQTSNIVLPYDNINKRFDTLSRSINTFDITNKLVKVQSETWNAGNSTWEYSNLDYQLYYYYEPFTPSFVGSFSPPSNIRIYPNPTSGILSVSNVMEGSRVEIIDMAGHIMGKVSSTKLNQKSIDISQYPTGSYIIQLTDKNGGRVTKKFIKGL